MGLALFGGVNSVNLCHAQCKILTELRVYFEPAEAYMGEFTESKFEHSNVCHILLCHLK